MDKEKAGKELNITRQPVLYKNKAFLPCKKQGLSFTATNKTSLINQEQPKIEVLNKEEQALKEEANSSTITTENAIPHLINEAEKEVETKEAIESTYETVKNQQSKKKRILNVVFLLLNLAILAAIFAWQFTSEETVSFADLLTSKLNWWWLIIAIAVFMLVNFIDASRVYIAIKKVTGRSRPWLSYKSVICCRFYDSITPLATGGQPFQVFYLNKRGLNASSATSVPLAKYIYSQITFVIMSAIILICSSGIVFSVEISPVVLTLCYIGLGLNMLLVLAIFFLSISKKVAPRMMFGILKMLKWMHIIKDSRALFKKVMRIVKEYVSTFRMFMSSGWLAFSEFLLSILYNIFLYSLAFIVYCIFCPFDINLWYTFFVLQLVCDLAISFIPLPGGAGTAELSFQSVFYSFYAAAGATNVLAWAVLFYRILTYYGYLIQGGLLLLYDFAIGNKKIEPMLQRFKDEEQRAKESNLIKMLENNGQEVKTDETKFLENVQSQTEQEKIESKEVNTNGAGLSDKQQSS